jgi:5'-nucleotidase
VLRTGLPSGILLNVNIPYEVEGGIRGVQITRQARSRWDEHFDGRLDPYDQPYYWLTGQFVNLDEGATDTDLAAIDGGYVSITPIHYDLTAYAWLDELRTWDIPPPPTL